MGRTPAALNFLARFTSKTNIQEMSVGQAFVTLPSFLEEFALSPYSSMVSMTPSAKVGITCWHKAGQYLLTSHAHANDITKAEQDF